MPASIRHRERRVNLSEVTGDSPRQSSPSLRRHWWSARRTARSSASSCGGSSIAESINARSSSESASSFTWLSSARSSRFASSAAPVIRTTGELFDCVVWDGEAGEHHPANLEMLSVAGCRACAQTGAREALTYSGTIRPNCGTVIRVRDYC